MIALNLHTYIHSLCHNSLDTRAMLGNLVQHSFYWWRSTASVHPHVWHWPWQQWPLCITASSKSKRYCITTHSSSTVTTVFGHNFLWKINYLWKIMQLFPTLAHITQCLIRHNVLYVFVWSRSGDKNRNINIVLEIFVWSYSTFTDQKALEVWTCAKL